MTLSPRPASPYVDQLAAEVREHKTTLEVAPVLEHFVRGIIDNLRNHGPELTDEQLGTVLLINAASCHVMSSISNAFDATTLANLLAMAGERLYHGSDQE